MELIISPEMERLLEDAGIRAEEVSCVLRTEGGILNSSDGTVTKGGQVGSLTIWVKAAPTENGYRLENIYFHRITVDGVQPCPEA